MIYLVEESTTLKIRPLKEGLTSEMLYKIQQIGNIKNVALDEEARKVKLEIELLEDKRDWADEDWEKREVLREKLQEAYVRCCKGYLFNIYLNVGDNVEDTYYVYSAEREASEEEVKYLSEKIKEICGDIEIEIECDRYKLDKQLEYDLTHPTVYLME